MIETEFFILTVDQYVENTKFADELGVTLDYYLSEFCEVEGPYITTD